MDNDTPDSPQPDGGHTGDDSGDVAPHPRHAGRLPAATPGLASPVLDALRRRAAADAVIAEAESIARFTADALAGARLEEVVAATEAAVLDDAVARFGLDPHSVVVCIDPDTADESSTSSGDLPGALMYALRGRRPPEESSFSRTRLDLEGVLDLGGVCIDVAVELCETAVSMGGASKSASRVSVRYFDPAADAEEDEYDDDGDTDAGGDALAERLGRALERIHGDIADDNIDDDAEGGDDDEPGRIRTAADLLAFLERHTAARLTAGS